jgi:hypothetical protein
LGKLTSAASWLSTEWAYTWAKVDVDTFATELFAYSHSSAHDEVFVPCSTNLDLIRPETNACLTCCPYRDTCGKCCVVIGVSHSEWAILETKLRNADSQCASGVTNASSHEDSASGCDIGLFGKSHVRDQQRCFAVAFAPLGHPSSMGSWTLISISRSGIERTCYWRDLHG